MNKTFKIILVFLLATLAVDVGLTIGALNDIYLFPNQWNVVSAQATMYLDNVEYPNNTVIDWGDVSADDYLFFDNFTVANTGSVNFTCHMIVQNLPAGWSLMWMANNTYVATGEIAYATLQLQVGSNPVEGPGGCSIIITTT